MKEKTYVLLGNPVPLARARHANGRVYDSQKQQKFCAGILISRQHDNEPQFEGPIELEATFYFTWTKYRGKPPHPFPAPPPPIGAGPIFQI